MTQEMDALHTTYVRLNEPEPLLRRVYFTLVDATTGDRLTGLTDPDVVMTVSINGGAGVAADNTLVEIDAVTHPGDYYYQLGDPTEINTLGRVLLHLAPGDSTIREFSVAAQVMPDEFFGFTLAATAAAVDAGLSAARGQGHFGPSHPEDRQDAEATLSRGRWIYGWQCDDAGPDMIASWGGADLTGAGTPTFNQRGVLGRRDGAVGLNLANNFSTTGAIFDIDPTKDALLYAVIELVAPSGSNEHIFTIGSNHVYIQVEHTEDEFSVGKQELTATFHALVGEGDIQYRSTISLTNFSPGYGGVYNEAKIPREPMILLAALNRSTNSMRVALRFKSGTTYLGNLVTGMNSDDFGEGGGAEFTIEGEGTGVVLLSHAMASDEVDCAVRVVEDIGDVIRLAADRVFGPSLRTRDGVVESVEAPYTNDSLAPMLAIDIVNTGAGQAEDDGDVFATAFSNSERWPGEWPTDSISHNTGTMRLPPSVDEDVAVEWMPSFGFEVLGGLGHRFTLQDNGGGFFYYQEDDIWPPRATKDSKIAFVISTDGTGNINVREFGSTVFTTTGHIAGDRFRVSREGTDIKFYRVPAYGADVLLYTDAAPYPGVAEASPLFGWVSAANRGYGAFDVRLSIAGVVQPTAWNTFTGGMSIKESVSLGVEALMAKVLETIIIAPHDTVPYDMTVERTLRGLLRHSFGKLKNASTGVAMVERDLNNTKDVVTGSFSTDRTSVIVDQD